MNLKGLAKENCLTYDMGTTCLSFKSCDKPGLNAELKTITSNKEYLGKSFEVENLKVVL